MATPPDKRNTDPGRRPPRASGSVPALGVPPTPGRGTTPVGVPVAVSMPASRDSAPRATPVLPDEAFRELVDNLRSVAVARLDLTGRVQSWNHGAERILGWAPPQIVGRHFGALHERDDVTRGLAERLLRDAANTGETQHDGWHLRQDGSRVWAHAVVGAIRTMDGALAGFALVLRDRSDALQAEASLRDTQARLHAILDQLPFGVVLAEGGGRITYANERAVDIAGVRTLPAATLAEAAGASAFLADGAPVPVEAWPVARALAAGEPVRDFQTRFVRADGREIWLRVDAAPLRADGKVAGAVGILTDVTEPRAAGERLRASEERFRGLAAASPAGVFQADLQGRMAYANPRLEALFQAPAGELQGGGWLTRVHPPDREPLIAKWTAASQRGDDHEHEVRVTFPGGAQRWMRVRAAVLRDAAGRPAGTAGTMEDVTDRVRAAEAVERATAELRAREAQLGAMLDASPVGVALFDADLRFTHVNDALALMHGVPAAQHTGRRVRELLPEHDGRLAETLRRVLETDAPDEATLTGITPARPGEPRTFAVRCLPLRGPGGIPVGVGALVQEVTDARRASLRLDAAERRARAVFDHAGVGIVTVEAGRIGEASESLAGLLGLPRDELAGRDVLALTHPGDRVALTRELRRVGAGDVAAARLDLRMLRRDGTLLWADATLTLVRDETGAPAHTLGVLQDVTPRRLAEAAVRASEERLRRAQAQLAAGVGGASDAGHALADHLSTLAVTLDLAREELGTAVGVSLDLALSPTDIALAAVAEDVDEAARAAARAAVATRGLLGAAGPAAPGDDRVDVNALVRRAEPFLRRFLPADLSLDLVLDPAAWPVRVPAAPLEQVLAQLVLAVRDALPPGGRIGIETVNLDVGEGARVPPGEYLSLTVLDTGERLAPDARAPMLRPFFRATPASQGSLAGLGAVHTLVAQWGGFVQAEGAAGRGNVFHLFFPRAVSPHDADDESNADGAGGGGETVLLAADDAGLRAATRRLLARRGYQVLEAASGTIALERWREHREAIAVVVADLRLPELDGLGLVARLRVDRPELAAVLLGAGAAPPRAPEDGAPADEVVLKPFGGDRLLRALRHALDARAAAPAPLPDAVADDAASPERPEPSPSPEPAAPAEPEGA